ncbi:uncharacterized protein [Ptychodera flava]|uniref:uncharacterized protein n=1 Tax=Ptychodera flava TaxID=63121 RepID=UPI00396A3419
MDGLSTNLNRKIDELNEEVLKLAGQAKESDERIACLEAENRRLNDEIDKLETELDKQQGQTKRENLLFHGLEQNDNETWEETEEIVKEFIKSNLNIDEDVDIERAHRITTSRAKPQPVIAKFSRYKDKVKVMKQARVLKNTLDTSVRVGEDFTERVREKRRKLWPTMNQALTDGKRATMRYDKLIIEGEVYAYDTKAEEVIKIKKR